MCRDDWEGDSLLVVESFTELLAYIQRSKQRVQIHYSGKYLVPICQIRFAVVRAHRWVSSNRTHRISDFEASLRTAEFDIFQPATIIIVIVTYSYQT